MKRLMVLALLAFAPFALAQTCDVVDVVYTTDVDVVVTPGSEPVSVATAVGFAYGLPLADAEDNTRLGKKIINEASQQQDKNGPYVVTYSEMRSCNGGPAVKADGVYVQGVTLKGGNKIARVALKVGDEITKRYEKRADKGDKFAHDHSKAKKIKRDENTKKRQRDPVIATD